MERFEPSSPTRIDKIKYNKLRNGSFVLPLDDDNLLATNNAKLSELLQRPGTSFRINNGTHQYSVTSTARFAFDGKPKLRVLFEPSIVDGAPPVKQTSATFWVFTPECEYGDWGTCSATACGTTGTQTRDMKTQPAGKACDETVRSCTAPACPAAAAAVCEYEEWGACSAAACGTTGTQTRGVKTPQPAGNACNETERPCTAPACSTAAKPSIKSGLPIASDGVVYIKSRIVVTHKCNEYPIVKTGTTTTTYTAADAGADGKLRTDIRKLFFDEHPGSVRHLLAVNTFGKLQLTPEGSAIHPVLYELPGRDELNPRNRWHNANQYCECGKGCNGCHLNYWNTDMETLYRPSSNEITFILLPDLAAAPCGWHGFASGTMAAGAYIFLRVADVQAAVHEIGHSLRFVNHNTIRSDVAAKLANTTATKPFTEPDSASGFGDPAFAMGNDRSNGLFYAPRDLEKIKSATAIRTFDLKTRNPPAQVDIPARELSPVHFVRIDNGSNQYYVCYRRRRGLDFYNGAYDLAPHLAGRIYVHLQHCLISIVDVDDTAHDVVNENGIKLFSIRSRYRDSGDVDTVTAHFEFSTGIAETHQWVYS